MKSIILICAICLQLGWNYGATQEPNGVGAFAYTDTNGQRYGGTYGLKDGQVTNVQGDYPGPYITNPYLGLDDFFPEHFRNYENSLQESRSRRFIFPLPPLPPLPPLRPFRRNPLKAYRNFYSNIPNQRLASDAPWNDFDLTSNQGGYIPYFAFRSPFSNFPGFPSFPALPTPPPFPSIPGFNMPMPMPMPMPNLGDNSAFASAALAPGFSQQIAAISPSNPNNPNVNVVNRLADNTSNPSGNFYSVSSSSYATSNTVNGKEQTQRGGQSVINRNGDITTYTVGN